MYEISDIKNKIFHGECSEILSNFPEECIDLVITSPPYDNLRDYKGYYFDCDNISKALFRVVKKGGVIIWVIGDSVIKGSESCTSFKHALNFTENGFNLHDTMIYEKNTSSFPARRNSNRYTQIFEYMFVFSKGKPKTANLICDKENRWKGWINWGGKTHRNKKGELIKTENIKPVPDFSPRTNIWKYNIGAKYGQTDNLAYQHPATFPEALVHDHITTWSNINDIVLDCMVGSGTTCKIAKITKRNYIGIDISEEYCKLAIERINLVKTGDENE